MLFMIVSQSVIRKFNGLSRSPRNLEELPSSFDAQSLNFFGD